MRKTLFARIKPFLKTLLVAGMVITMAFSSADGALAARSGGRIGGGGFRSPSRTAPAPRAYPPGGGGYYPGGGFGFPFILPFFGFGGGFGGLFTILIFIAIANFLVQSFRNVQSGGGNSYSSLGGSSSVSVSKLQVGLLAQARSLQTDLDRIATTANTSSNEGLALVLQEATLSLLRHPEYWAYANAGSQQTSLESAEREFYRLAMAERSKLSEETLSNYNNQLRQKQESRSLPSSGDIVPSGAPGEYIIVTLLVAAEGKLQLPKVNSTQELRQALGQLGSIPSERLMALEILWEPQAEGDALSADELIAEYPDLTLI